MNRQKLTRIILTIVIVALGILLVVKLFSREPKPPVVTPPKTAMISISEDGFVPGTVKIKTGTVVIWTNNDSSPHRVAADPFPTHTSLPALDSKTNMDQGGTYRFTFDKAGTYKYHDELKPKHSGVVIVE